MTLAVAGLADEEAIMALLRLKHEEDGLGRFHEPCARTVVRLGLAQDFGMVGVIRGRKGLEATIGLYVTQFWYTADPHLTDRWAYVHPDCRRSSHAKAMIEFAKSTAVKMGLPLVMAAITNDKTAQKEQLYRRQLPHSGSLFVFNAPGVAA